MAINKRNWVENYHYLNMLFNSCQDLKTMPSNRNELEAYFNRIDNYIPKKEFVALLRRTYNFVGDDPIFINKVKNILSKENIIGKRKFDALWKETLINAQKDSLEKDKKEIEEIIDLEVEIPEDYLSEIDSLLLSENKFEFIKEILDYRIVHEDKNKVLVFLLLSGAYTNNHQIIFEIGESTGGKSHIAENVVDLFPDKHTWTLTGASDKALIYKNWENEKIIHIPEAQRNPAIQENLKDFGDRGIFYNTVEKNEANKFETREIIIGKKSIILTTTIDGLNPQLENRAWKLEPNHSIEQSKEIVKQSIEQREDLIRTLDLEKKQEKNEKILKFSIFSMEKEYCFDKIEVPFLRELEHIFDYSFLKIRRDHKKFFELLNIITSWNYKLREYFELDNFKILLSHPNDLIATFEIGEEIFMNLTRNLTPEKRKILDCFANILQKEERNSKKKSKGEQQQIIVKEKKKGKDYFNTNEVYDSFSFQENYRKSKKTFRNLLNSLAEDGWLEKEKKGRDNVYKVREGNTLKLLDEEQRKEIYIKCFELYNHRKEILKSMKRIKYYDKKINSIKLNNLNLYSNDLYTKIFDVFKANNTKRLDLDSLIQILSIDKANEKVEEEIHNMIKLGLFTKNFDNELILNN